RATGRRVWSRETGEKDVLKVSFSADGRTLASGKSWGATPESRKVVRLWDVGTGRDGPSSPQPGPAPAQVAFAPAGQILAVIGSRDFVWDLATDRQQSLPPSSRPGSSRAVA